MVRSTFFALVYIRVPHREFSSINMASNGMHYAEFAFGYNLSVFTKKYERNW